MDNPKHFKVVFLGENYVGKTVLIDSFFNGYFSDTNYSSTCGLSCKTKTINHGNKNYSFDIWDTPGYERYRSLYKFFLKDANIIVLVYDIAKEYTFLELDYWINAILTQIGPEVSIILVGNKSDLFENEEIREEDAVKFAEILNAKFSLISVKENPFGWRYFLENSFIDYIKNFEKNKK